MPLDEKIISYNQINKGKSARRTSIAEQRWIHRGGEGGERRPGEESNKWAGGRRLWGGQGRRSARCAEHFGGWFFPSGSAGEGVCVCSSTGWNTPSPLSSHTHTHTCPRWTESSDTHIHVSKSQRTVLFFGSLMVS